MSVTHTVVISAVKAANIPGLAVSLNITGDFEQNVSILVPAQTGSPLTGANFPINYATTRSKLKYVFIQASRAGTLYTNAPSSGSPQDTIVLPTVTDVNGNTVGSVWEWVLEMEGIGRCIFSGDVTSMYFTPPVLGADTLFQIYSIHDN